VDAALSDVITAAIVFGAVGSPQPGAESVLWEAVCGLAPSEELHAFNASVVATATARWPTACRRLHRLLLSAASDSDAKSSGRDWRVQAKCMRWCMALQTRLSMDGAAPLGLRAHERIFASASRFQLHGAVQLAEVVLADSIKRGASDTSTGLAHEDILADMRTVRALIMRGGDLLRRAALEPEAGPSKAPTLDTVRFAGRWLRVLAGTLLHERALMSASRRSAGDAAETISFADENAPWLAGIDAACGIMHLHPPTRDALHGECIARFGPSRDGAMQRMIVGLRTSPIELVARA
jgi:hypothetical protein